MRLLLDTHIFLWMTTGSTRLKSSVRDLIVDAEQVWVSAASIWEIAIKSRIGKLAADPVEMAFEIGASGFIELPITSQHAATFGRLDLHHHDPFDRLLVAQAASEQLRLVTSDTRLRSYSDLVLLV
jgi:PIN domain nuclease of toxin-antitoxin system